MIRFVLSVISVNLYNDQTRCFVDRMGKYFSSLLAASVATESGEIPVTIRDLFARWDKDYLQHHHTDQGEYVRNLFNNHILNQQYADLRLNLVINPAIQ